MDPQGIAPNPDETAFDALMAAALQGRLTSDLLESILESHAGLGDTTLARLRGVGVALRAQQASQLCETQALSAEPDLPFESLGGFRLLRRLGEGGMGTVYLAEQPSPGRLVALKVVREGALPDAFDLIRFRREIDALSKIRHPHVVSIFAAGEQDGVSWYAMELLPGRDLEQLIEEARGGRGEIPLRTRLTWIRELADALGAVHEAGFVHRDVKPANIRIGTDNRAVLMDFGLSRSADSPVVTAVGSFTGTPLYASPEQVEGRLDDVNGQSDLFSLGVTLFELLTGELPFRGVSEQEILRAIRAGKPPSVRTTNPALSQALDELVQSALDQDPAGRPPTAAALSHSLKGLIRSLPDQAPPAQDRRHVGPYRLLEPLGTGGMGEVWLAERDDEQFKMQVALKRIKAGMDTEEILRRFRNERQLLAQLKHPNIARLLDGGVDQEGRPFLAMEYVDGGPIDSWCKERSLPVRDRLRLFQKVCGAVSHAHRLLVVHRDLKPGNILVDGEGQPKLLDFGIAKVLDPGETGLEVDLTRSSSPLTPKYAAPEQLTEGTITTATDQYALGVLLHHLLSGQGPYRVKRETYSSYLRAIVHDEPVAPSAATTNRTGTRVLRGDVDAIVLKALRKRPENRYASVDELSADIERHLEGLPVLARGGAVRYRISRFARRHWLPLAAAVVVLVSLVTATIVSFRFALSERRQAAIATEKETEATARKAEFDQLAGVVLLEEALEAEQDLYPAWPETQLAMETWLAGKAAELINLKPTLDRTLSDLEARVPSWTQAEHQRDRTTDPSTDPSTEELEPESQRFLYDTLSNLSSKIAAFDQTERKQVEARLAWAREIEGLTLNHPNASYSWNEAREAIAAADGVLASDLYRDRPVDLQAQFGLVPIGMNPVTQLWEFYHLRSAWNPASGLLPAEIAIPEHAEDGSIEVTDGTGIVFVLIPGGTFRMGAQSNDPDQPNYAAQAYTDEVPVLQVTLDAYLLARHELTVGQWSRLTGGGEPGWHKRGLLYDGDPNPFGWTHPVEQISWEQTTLELSRHGLLLPTEAQWECAARGGTTTAWWTGSDPSSLAGAANVLDRRAEAKFPLWGHQQGDFDDGFVGFAPVGQFRANPYGLFDVHGNVWEWCRDGYDSYAVGVRDGDGLRGRRTEGVSFGISRGGSCSAPALSARSSYRLRQPPSNRSLNLGLRPSRSLRR